MNFTNAVQIAQIISSLGALIAAACSLYVANRARNEVRVDRRLKFAPIVAFEPGGYILNIIPRKFGHRIPGCDPSFVERDFSSFRCDGKALFLENSYGSIKNIGSGPALEIRVEFVAETVTIGDELFNIDDKKKGEARYSAAYNTIPPAERILLSGTKSPLERIPTFVYLDFENQVSSIEGKVRISYTDIAGSTYTTVQQFIYFNKLTDGKCRYGMTFGRIEDMPRIT